MASHTVKILPLQTTLQVDEDTNLLTAFREAGIYVKSSCGGHATCGDCLIKIVEGTDNINAPSFEETKLIGNVFHITKERLSCQSKLTGDITVDLSSHDESVDAEKLKSKAKKFIKSKSPVRKRSKEDVEKIHAERDELRKSKKDNQEMWQKHWEKDKDPLSVPRKGGSKRPKPFRTDHLDPEEEDVQGTEDSQTSADPKEES